jgi:hypothetical protein
LEAWYALILLVIAYQPANNPKAETAHTISGIWAGYKASTILQQHYAIAVASQALTGPGLPTPNPIPDKPYTKANAEKAKKKGILRDGLPQAPPVATSSAPPTTQAPNRVNQPSISAGAHRIPAPPTELYPWWPDRKWDPDNEPKLGLPEDWDRVSIEERNEYFKKSKFPSPENEDDVDLTQWYGVRLLGNGASGIASLWVKVDEDNVIQDVSDPFRNRSYQSAALPVRDSHNDLLTMWHRIWRSKTHASATSRTGETRIFGVRRSPGRYTSIS